MEQQPLLVIMPEDGAQIENARLQQILQYAVKDYPVELWRKAEQFVPVQNRRILFVLNLGADGVNLEYQKAIAPNSPSACLFYGCTGGCAD